ncbi:MAG: sorbosone dehydrogenase family protein [Gammaproteobacteria bacterium]|nr:sorbosone dehydrogenase family protein [Gammaproteobacteria bacterium]
MLLAVLLCACSESATLSIEEGSGPHPALPAPVSTLLPTIDIAPAEGWSPGQTPTPAAGLRVAAFARNLDHPRWLLVLPNGDVLVAETNAPVDHDAGFSIKTWATKLAMKRAGAGVASADRITLLRDGDGDGVAEMRQVFLSALPSPFGMALVGHRLFVATADTLLEFPYQDGETAIAAAPIKRLALPGGPINHHWTKNVLASKDGQSLYIAVGSNSNVAERGMAAEAGRAAIWRFDLASGAHRIFATGLRNPVGMSWDGSGGRLWTVVNERDELGSDLVPDYLTAVHDGAFYGWPYSYFGQHLDPRAPPAPPAQVTSATVPDYALGPHTASLGLTWSDRGELPAPFRHGMFIGQHGSWNRRPLSGYRVIFVPFEGDGPVGLPIEVLSGFLSADGRARGRPVGVQMDSRGGLLVADDVGNVIWRVTARP